MIDVILFQPEIPQNTGNIGRLCAFTQSRLHLIHPLGFKITDKTSTELGYGLLAIVASMNIITRILYQLIQSSKNIYLFSTHANRPMWEANFQRGDGLLFGKEEEL